jgi:hypothetical protein
VIAGVFAPLPLGGRQFGWDAVFVGFTGSFRRAT